MDLAMQILQRVFSGAYRQEIWRSTFSSPTKWEAIRDENAKGKDIITLKHHRAHRRTQRINGRKLGCKNLKLFTFICGKDIPKACFYRTLNLDKVRNLNRRRHFVHCAKMKTEELSRVVGITKREDLAARVGKKVMPITEASFSISTERNGQFVTAQTKDETKGDRKRTISRMKELLGWVAAAKTKKREIFNEQKVLQFRRQENMEAVPDDDQLKSESPKISFTWDVETSIVHSVASSFENGQAHISLSHIHILPEEGGHITCRKGNWITTDSEFVVLEL